MLRLHLSKLRVKFLPVRPALWLALLLLLNLILTPTVVSARRHAFRRINAQASQMPPIVPTVDATMKARLRAILTEGAATGNRTTVFAKIGDSITESGSFLTDIGCSAETLGDHSELAPVIAYFRSTTLPANYTAVWCGIANAFTRASASAVTGWSADSILAPVDDSRAECLPGESALNCELRVLHPAVALIMVGTNDLERFNDLVRYRTALTAIVTETVAAGVIPVLSTLPPRLDQTVLNTRVAAYNQVVQEVAEAQQIPLWNFWLATQAPQLLNQGISEDGIHPNIFPCGESVCAADFTAAGLRYGYNQRNLTALQVLAKIKAVVFDDGAPDTSAPAATPTATTTALPSPTVPPATTIATPFPTTGAGNAYLPLILRSLGQTFITLTPPAPSPTPLTTPTPMATVAGS